ncbi:MAG TPA: DoxX family protein [Kofleriaceae bacterium]|nr:DoxX family protein [Kofleriaceae bacterium]
MSDLALHPSTSFSTTGAARYAVPVGRTLFGLLFVLAAPGHFSSDTIGMAAAQGVPLASFAVPLSGVISALGGLGVALGYRARISAALLVAFLVPVTLAMHAFWAAPDPMMAMIHRVMFMKNVALIGGALLIAYFGAGPLSLDARRAKAA